MGLVCRLCNQLIEDHDGQDALNCITEYAENMEGFD